MKLNQLPNFRVEDFPAEQSTWLSKLFIQLNPFVQAVSQVFDNNLDFTTNIKAVTRTYTITQFQAFSFQWTYPEQAPLDLRVISAFKGTQLTPTILMAAWSYDATNEVVRITRMSEVNEASVSALSGRYQFTIRVTV